MSQEKIDEKLKRAKEGINEIKKIGKNIINEQLQKGEKIESLEQNANELAGLSNMFFNAPKTKKDTSPNEPLKHSGDDLENMRQEAKKFYAPEKISLVQKIKSGLTHFKENVKEKLHFNHSHDEDKPKI